MPMTRGQKQFAQVPLNQTLYQKANADGVAENSQIWQVNKSTICQWKR